MKKQEWNEEQIEQLLKQLPPVKDKQTPEDLYMKIQAKQISKKYKKTWFAPTFAAVAALFILALILPSFFQSFTQNNNQALDNISTSSQSAKQEQKEENQEIITNELDPIEKNSTTVDNNTDDKQETFVTSTRESEEVITVGFTDAQAQNILPISIEAPNVKDKLQQIEEINPEDYTDDLGPVSFELSGSEFSETESPEEINIIYKGEPNVSSSANEILYQTAIKETFRWQDYTLAHLYTNDKVGIEFGQTGPLNELQLNLNNKKAYFVYQFDDEKRKLLVPSPESYQDLNQAVEAMNSGIEERMLKPTINDGAEISTIEEQGTQLTIEFSSDSIVQNDEASIIMLEALLLTAKEFGFQTVQFKETDSEQIGVMDVTMPIEVPYSPNPVKAD